ncbi:HEAT repeat domain-containing protein [Egbenema bharatensis]|uniref:HEAT repeat domain-containing protein n=1 Tax=Egbenema bharatensis TaxID=3463334 RepID=UPI003A88BB49
MEFELQSALHLLKNGDFQARWDVAKTFPNLGVTAIDPLIELLQEADADWELLWFIARILGNLKHPDAIHALSHLCATTDHIDVAEMAATALAQQGATAILALTHLLDQEPTRLLAVQALAQIRHPDVMAPLCRAAHDAHPTVRAAAIESLSHFHEPAVSAILLSSLSDANPIVRKASILGLGIQAEQFQQPELVEHLKPYLRDFNLDVCHQTAVSLSRIGTDAAIEALADVLHAPHTPFPLQIEIVRALSWIGTPTALQPLQHQLHQTAAAIPAATSTLHHEILAALGRIESEASRSTATEILLEQLQSNPPAMQDLRSKQTIALSLGQLGQPTAISPLIQQLADPNISVRLHTIAALKQLDAALSLKRLQSLLEQPELDQDLRQGVEVALREW